MEFTGLRRRTRFSLQQKSDGVDFWRTVHHWKWGVYEMWMDVGIYLDRYRIINCIHFEGDPGSYSKSIRWNAWGEADLLQQNGDGSDL